MTPGSPTCATNICSARPFWLHRSPTRATTSREVYLPAGTDWYNFWTNERVKGGQTITVAAPIDTIPLFVRAGSIIPLGATVESTHQPQAIAQISVYPGADASLHALLRRRHDLCL